MDLTLSSGLAASPAAVDVAVLLPGASRSIPFSVKVPIVQMAGLVTATAAVKFTRIPGEQRSFSSQSTLVTIDQATSLTSTVATSSPGDLASTALVTSVVANTASASISGHIVVVSPTGWQQPIVGPDVVVSPGKNATVTTNAPIPQSVTAESVSLTVTFVSGTTVLATNTDALPIALLTPPAAFTDHVDFGDATSEAAHNVMASPSSGTSIEAGLTRRYSGVTTPGSYFEFTGSVTAGKPFIFRALETYDQAQIKDYDITVNGTRVATRLYSRTAEGAGTVTYQLLIPDDGTLTSTGKVTIRMTYTGTAGHYDPSIADVWLLTAG